MNTTYKDEEARQRDFHNGHTEPRDTVDLVTFLEHETDWILLAGGKSTVKIMPDKYSGSGEYITQSKKSKNTGKPKSKTHKDYSKALSYARRYISSGADQ